MKQPYKAGKLNRFTSLPVLLDLLKRRKIVLLDPASWEDKNDTEILIEYKKRKTFRKSLLFAFRKETRQFTTGELLQTERVDAASKLIKQC